MSEPVAWAKDYAPIDSQQHKTLVEWAKSLPTDGTVPDVALKALLAAPPQDALDAKRYRWLRENGHAAIYVLQAWAQGDEHLPLALAQREKLDAIADAAMQEPPK